MEKIVTRFFATGSTIEPPLTTTSLQRPLFLAVCPDIASLSFPTTATSFCPQGGRCGKV